jgi:hypothetical protein
MVRSGEEMGNTVSGPQLLGIPLIFYITGLLLSQAIWICAHLVSISNSVLGYLYSLDLLNKILASPPLSSVSFTSRIQLF